MLNEVALGVVIAWIVLVIIFFIFLLIKFTFKKWPPGETNPYAKESLGMPRGVMRSVLTLSVLFIVILLEVNSLAFDPKKLTASGELFVPEDRFKEMLVAFQMIIAFYFGSKVMHHVTKSDRAKAEKQAETAVAEAKHKAELASRQGFTEEGTVG